jgi:hypothetical protein
MPESEAKIAPQKVAGTELCRIKLGRIHKKLLYYSVDMTYSESLRQHLLLLDRVNYFRGRCCGVST